MLIKEVLKPVPLAKIFAVNYFKYFHLLPHQYGRFNLNIYNIGTAGSIWLSVCDSALSI